MTEHTLKDVQRMLEIAVTMLEKIQEREDTTMIEPDPHTSPFLQQIERRKIDFGISARQYRHFHASDGVEPRRKDDPGAKADQEGGGQGDSDGAVPEVQRARDETAGEQGTLWDDVGQ